MSNFYPTLDTELASDSLNVNQVVNNRHRVSTADTDDIEIVLQIPSENILITFVHSTNEVRELRAPLSVINAEPYPYLEFDQHRVDLKETLFCLHSDLETFVLGGSTGPIDGTNYHLVFNLSDTPDDVLVALTCVFMSNCTYRNLFVDEQPYKEQEIGDKVASAINYGAHGIGKGLFWVGDKTTNLLQSGAGAYVQKYEPSTTPAQIPQSVQTTVQYVSTGSKYVAKGTGYVASAIGTAATFVGKQIATKIDEKYGKDTDPNSASRKSWTQAGKIASGLLSGYGTVWSALETVGKSVAVDARDASTIMVQHRHGNEAGDVTYNAMNIGVNMTKTFFHIEDFGLKKVCKNIAKSTGKEYLQQHLDRRNGKQLRTGDTGTSQVPPQRPPQPIY